MSEVRSTKAVVPYATPGSGRERPNGLPIGLLSICLLGLIGLCSLFVDVMPRSAITPNAMGETSARIEVYFQRHKRLPANLSVLPVRADHANRTTDAWGRPLRYTVDAADAFTLSSYGANGVPGGRGDAADVVWKYRIEGGVARRAP